MSAIGDPVNQAATTPPGQNRALPQPFPRSLGPNAMRYLQEVVDSGLTCDMVGRFERAFAREYGVKHCIATPGCTPALAILAAAFGFAPGDEVIVSPVTDYGTIMGLVHQGYIPVFADAAPGTVNLSAATIEPCLSNRTRAILCVHKTGLICDMDPINALATRYGLTVYEDACQAVFGVYKGRLAGTLAKAGAFSFDAEKTMGADVGGCIVTNDEALAARLRFLGQHRGAVTEPHFGRRHVEAGYAYRMAQCTAALCLAQLEVVREQVGHRDRMIRLLTRLLAEIPGVTPLPIPAYVELYSAWMVGISLDPQQFTCDAETFGLQLVEAGIPGVGPGRYYLMTEACPFLTANARNHIYPYSSPPASREYDYASACPRAKRFLQNWLRWSTFCEKWTAADSAEAARLVRLVADRNRRRQ